MNYIITLQKGNEMSTYFDRCHSEEANGFCKQRWFLFCGVFVFFEVPLFCASFEWESVLAHRLYARELCNGAYDP